MPTDSRKNYRLLRIAKLGYRQPVDELYRERPELKDCSYAEQRQALLQKSLVYTGAFAREMRALGNEAEELLVDCEPLQKAWAREQGLEPGENWQEEILLAQIQSYAPDIAYFQDLHSLRQSLRQELKSICDSIKLLVLHKGFPGPASEVEEFDLRFFGTPGMCEQYRAEGMECSLLYHGFDDGVLDELKSYRGSLAAESAKVTFLGSSGYGHPLHRGRYWWLLQLLKSTGIELCTDEAVDENYNPDRPVNQALYRALETGDFEQAALKVLEQNPEMPEHERVYLFQRMERIVRERHNALSVSPLEREALSKVPPIALRILFPSRCHPPVFGLEMYSILRDSLVTLNKHTDAIDGAVGNMRLFEASGVGACLLTDQGSNLSDLFAPDDEVVAFSSTAECIEKLRYLQSNPQVAKEIARRGQERTLRSHTIKCRVEVVDEHIQRLL